jgi:hypothetical protein
VPLWPPFIPPSLKALRIFMIDGNLVEGLLPALPGMLAASGAKLNRLEFYLPYDFPCLEDGLINVAQALRCCSPTLKDFRLATEVDSLCIDKDDEDYEKQSERMRGRTCSPAWWAATSFRCSSFRSVEVEPLFPSGTVFARLTHLEVSAQRARSPAPLPV